LAHSVLIKAAASGPFVCCCQEEIEGTEKGLSISRKAFEFEWWA